MPDILIIGAGAVGMGVGAGLIKAGANVTFLDNEAKVEALRNGGCHRIGIFGEIHNPPEAFSATVSYDLDKSFDYIIVSAKAMANGAIAKALFKHPALFKESCRIIIFQNGLNTNTAYEALFDKSIIFNARIITGFSAPEPNVSLVTVHREPLLLGSVYGFSEKPLEDIAALISSTGFEARTSPDVAKAIWSKVIYNCALNPLGAVLNAPYGYLSESPDAKEYVSHIVDEAFAVMTASGASTFAKDSEEYKTELFEKSIPLTASHRSSTLQDIQKKQRTEIDTLNGAISDLGKKYGVPTPFNDAITLIIRALQGNI